MKKVFGKMELTQVLKKHNETGRWISRIMLLAILLCVVSKSRFWHQSYEMAVVPCVSGLSVLKMAEVAGINDLFASAMAGEVITKENELVMEDIRMQVVYQLARRSVVKVIVKDAAGSGIIWKIDDDIVIVSSRHLLMKDVSATVVFCNEEAAEAEIIGYSQQYDIGFIRVAQEHVSDSILRSVFEAVPIWYGIETETDKRKFAEEYAGRTVLQIGANIQQGVINFSIGDIIDLNFVPIFNTNVLETRCFSRAGMSGGGVFDDSGRILGMISGGDVLEQAEEREAELTFSLPSMLIDAEYDQIIADG